MRFPLAIFYRYEWNSRCLPFDITGNLERAIFTYTISKMRELRQIHWKLEAKLTDL